MTRRILLCADVDGTVLPSGPEPESPEARPRLRRVAARPEVTFAYASGRDRRLLEEAIRDFDLPAPDYAIGDVGATIFAAGPGGWERVEEWRGRISKDWRGLRREDLARLLEGTEGLRLQEPEKQGEFKLSYYTPPDVDRDALMEALNSRLSQEGVRADSIFSMDEVAGVGLLDILPQNATKRDAVRFLMEREGFSEEETVYAGDSGNDLPVFASGLQAVIVRNAPPSLQDEAEQQAAAAKRRLRLYMARGGFLGMNGNYAAGVLEGLAHFIPESAAWMDGS